MLNTAYLLADDWQSLICESATFKHKFQHYWLLKMVQFSLYKGSFKCENVVSFRGLHPLTPWPGALPLDHTGGYVPRPPYRLVLPHSPSPSTKKSLIRPCWWLTRQQKSDSHNSWTIWKTCSHVRCRLCMENTTIMCSDMGVRFARTQTKGRQFFWFRQYFSKCCLIVVRVIGNLLFCITKTFQALDMRKYMLIQCVFANVLFDTKKDTHSRTTLIYNIVMFPHRNITLTWQCSYIWT